MHMPTIALCISSHLVRRAVLGVVLVTPWPAFAQSYEIVHGRWFDGNAFVARTVYVDRGVIDLSGKFVVGPYSEAHNHNIEGSPAATIKKYLDAGIYYVKDPCSFPEASVERGAWPAPLSLSPTHST